MQARSKLHVARSISRRARQGQEAVGEVRAEQPLPGLEQAARRLDPVAIGHVKAGALEQGMERRGVLPVGVVLVDGWVAVAPDLPDLTLIEGIGGGDDQRALRLEVAAHVAEEDAGILK